MNQSMLNSFKKKIGVSAFDTIENMIQEEITHSNIKITYSNEYLLYLFEIAILKNCNIEDKNIPTIIFHMGNSYIPTIDFQLLQNIHQNSILLIQSYFTKNANK